MRRLGLAEFSHPQRHGSERQLVAGGQGLLGPNALPVDVCSIGATEITDGQLAAGFEDFAVTPADLRRLDANPAVVVPADAVTPSDSLRVVLALRPRTTWST